jgi:hypothetical protein
MGKGHASAKTHRLVRLLPDADRPVVRARDNKLCLLRDRDRPDLAVVAVHLLDELKLVTVPVLHRLVLADRPKVMAVLLERDLHDRVVVRKQRLVAVAKVKPPDLDVLVGRACDEQLRIGRDVHVEHRQLVAVEREEELERVLVEDLDGRVKQRNREQPAVGRVADREDVVRHLERLGVDEREHLLLELSEEQVCWGLGVSGLLERSGGQAAILTTRVTPSRSTCVVAPSSTSSISKSQNLTSLSALPLTSPFLSGRTWSDQTAPEWAWTSEISVEDETS